MASIQLYLLLVAAVMIPLGAGGYRKSGGQPHNYGDALTKCLVFFEGQRSGKLPATQRLTWRKDSALDDGRDAGVDLAGGYYDAGDNVKFGFPLAFTATMLGWSIIEFGNAMGSEYAHAEESLRWITDYLLKSTAEPNKVYIQVGDPIADHNCWERPEDMDTSRKVWAVDSNMPGSEVAAETAAALAAASIVFKTSDPGYAQKLLDRSITVFDFAEKYRGSYSNSVGDGACPFYCDTNGYEDELVWGATWIHKASNSTRHWDYVNNNVHKLDQVVGEFGWDAKNAGAFVLLYKENIATVGSPSDYFHQKAEQFACTVLPESPSKGTKYTPGGLIYKGGGIQNPSALSYLLVVFAQYLANANQAVDCGNGASIPPSRLIEVAKTQVDYILGDNPLGLSYMVGYGLKFPQRIHHRAASMPSVGQHPERILCKGGTPYYESQSPNPNLLIGAIVAGPDENDAFADSRVMPKQSEPMTYINAPMAGLLAYFKSTS